MNTDDTSARVLLGPMLDEAIPSSKVDVSQLVAAGRRRVRARRWAGVTGAGALTAAALVTAVTLVPQQNPPHLAASATMSPAVPATSAAPAARPAPAFPASCTAKLLRVPNNAAESEVRGGDPSGRYLVGGYSDSRGNRLPVLWENGTPIAIPAPGENLYSIAVNAAGVVAGTSDKVSNGKIELFNWVYRDGKVSLLGEVLTEPSKFIQVVDINSRGDILADTRSSGGQTDRQRPGIWKAGGGFQQLADPGNLGQLTAFALDDDGSVAGRYMAGPGFEGERSLLWTSDGRLTTLAPPTGYGPGGALRLLRSGWAIGSYQQPGKQPHETVVFRRNVRTGEDTPIAPIGLFALAGAVNAHGWVAGLVRESARVQTPALAFVVGTGTKLLKLPLPAGAVASSDGVGAYYLSDDATTVAGNVAVSNDRLAAAVWTCQ